VPEVKITMDVVRVVRAGDDLAVLYNDWRLVGRAADGSPFAMTHKAMEIVRRQSDGTWRFAVDDPYARG
jgi:ketosteroid isomerase-like protein